MHPDLHLSLGRGMRPNGCRSAAQAPLAGLLMLCEYFNGTAELEAIKEGLVDKDRMVVRPTMVHSDLARIAKELKLRFKVLTDVSNVSPRAPFLARLAGDHYVVVKRRGRNFKVWDPLQSVEQIWKEEAFRSAVVDIYEVAALWQFREVKPGPQLRWRDILGKVVGLKRSLGLIFIVAVFVEILNLLGPLMIQIVTDQALTAGDRELIEVLILGFTLLLVMRVAAEGARSWAVMVLGIQFSLQWLTNVYGHILHLPVSYFERRSLADILDRFGVIGAIQSTLTIGVLEALLDALLVLGVGAMMFFYSPALAGLAIVAALLYGLAQSALFQMRRSLAYRDIKTGVQQDAAFIESVESMASIRALNGGSVWSARWANLAASHKNAEFASSRLEWGFRLVRIFIFGLASVLVVGLGAIAVLNRNLSIGMLLAMTVYQELFTRRVGNLIDRIFEFKLLELQGIRLADVILTRPEGDAYPAISLEEEEFVGRFEARAMRYKYFSAPSHTLDGVSFSLEPGTLAHFSGRRASGKTTLCRALLGLYVPGGDVFLDGISARQMGWLTYRENVRGVVDGDRIFSGTILDNITAFSPQPDRQRALHCLEVVGLTREVQSLPAKIESTLKIGGRPLSGSQVALLKIARALYISPRVLILDEVLSAVDHATEAALLDRLRGESITVCYFSERTQYRNFDRMFRITAGRVEAVKSEPTKLHPGSVSLDGPTNSLSH